MSFFSTARSRRRSRFGLSVAKALSAAARASSRRARNLAGTSSAHDAGSGTASRQTTPAIPAWSHGSVVDVVLVVLVVVVVVSGTVVEVDGTVGSVVVVVPGSCTTGRLSASTRRARTRLPLSPPAGSRAIACAFVSPWASSKATAVSR